jgi:hypothetical protein
MDVDLYDDVYDELFDDELIDDLDGEEWLDDEDWLDDEFDDELAETMAMFPALTPAESFNIAKAIGQVGKGAAQAFEDPTVRQIAAAAAPIAGGAAGTALGGPVGTAVGTSLGAAAGKALAPKPATPAPKPPGSTAATKALVLSQQPDVLQALLALAVGNPGRSEVNGIPVGAVMNMLSAMYARAAEDADELMEMSGGAPSYLFDAEGALIADPAAPRERADALYAALIGSENELLTEAGLA